jgi:hypothetical protein
MRLGTRATTPQSSTRSGRAYATSASRRARRDDRGPVHGRKAGEKTSRSHRRADPTQDGCDRDAEAGSPRWPRSAQTRTIPIVMVSERRRGQAGLGGEPGAPGRQRHRAHHDLARAQPKAPGDSARRWLPKLSRVGVLWVRARGRSRSARGELNEETQAAASLLKVTPSSLEVARDAGPGERDRDSGAPAVDAISCSTARAFTRDSAQIVDLAATHRLPALYPYSLSRGGRALQLRPRPCATAAHRAAGLRRQDPEGAPSRLTLPVEQPTKFERSSTARRQGAWS